MKNKLRRCEVITDYGNNQEAYKKEWETNGDKSGYTWKECLFHLWHNYPDKKGAMALVESISGNSKGLLFEVSFEYIRFLD